MSITALARTRDKVRAHRNRLRRQGLRPVQMWVLDTSAEGFRREALRQSRLVAAAPDERADQALVDAVSNWPIE